MITGTSQFAEHLIMASNGTESEDGTPAWIVVDDADAMLAAPSSGTATRSSTASGASPMPERSRQEHTPSGVSAWPARTHGSPGTTSTGGRPPEPGKRGRQ